MTIYGSCRGDGEFQSVCCIYEMCRGRSYSTQIYRNKMKARYRRDIKVMYFLGKLRLLNHGRLVREICLDQMARNEVEAFSHD